MLCWKNPMKRTLQFLRRLLPRRGKGWLSDSCIHACELKNLPSLRQAQGERQYHAVNCFVNVSMELEFPTPVGMNRAGSTIELHPRRVPHARRDEPSVDRHNHGAGKNQFLRKLLLSPGKRWLSDSWVHAYEYASLFVSTGIIA